MDRLDAGSLHRNSLKIDAEVPVAFVQNRNAALNNVLWKRKDQIARWEQSETNRLSSLRKSLNETKVKFTEEDVFLSACLANDFDEIQVLLDKGADINTCTVDGLTAMHQAVIDGKPDMIQFLCEQGANVNAQDNEGWTPLHAAACCGNLSLVRYLCSEGADIGITNSDQELAIDLVEEDDCRIFLEEEHRRRKIDPNDCRNREFSIMKRDAEEWLRTGEYRDRPDQRTGASALHVAASKGYVDVLKLLIKAGADLNARDRDGWTALHAAAHWAEHESAVVLIQNGASINERTINGESVLDVADKKILDYLEGAAENERSRLANNSSINVTIQSHFPLKRAGSATSVLRMSTEEKSKKTKLDEQDESKELRFSLLVEEKTPSPSVEARLPFPSHVRDTTSKSLSDDERISKCSSISRSSSSISKSSSCVTGDVDTESKNSSEKAVELAEQEEFDDLEIDADITKAQSKSVSSEASEIDIPYVKSSSSSSLSNQSEVVQHVMSENNSTVVTSSSHRNSSDSPVLSSPTPPPKLPKPSWLRYEMRFSSLQNDINNHPPSTLHDTYLKKNTNTSRSASVSSSVPWMALYKSSPYRTGPMHPAFAQFQSAVRQSCTNTTSKINAPVFAAPLPPSSSSEKSDKSTTLISSSTRSTLSTPPTEPNLPKESESERRSKAKRQRDCRRSTQGVTREQLRAAVSSSVRHEEKENNALPVKDVISKENSSLSSKILTNAEGNATSTQNETRSSDASRSSTSQENQHSETFLNNMLKNDTNASDGENNAAPYSVISSTVANIRRRSQVPRNSRRGTGPIQCGDEFSVYEKGNARDSDSSNSISSSPSPSTLYHTHYIPCTSSVLSTSTTSNAVTNVIVSMRNKLDPPKLSSSPSNQQSIVDKVANSVDYKTLYENEKLENEKLRKSIDELSLKEQNKNANGPSIVLKSDNGRHGGLLSVNKSTSTSSLIDQERKTLERRIADLQYEIKQLEHLRTDNQRLKEENGALIRVISKLSK